MPVKDVSEGKATQTKSHDELQGVFNRSLIVSVASCTTQVDSVVVLYNREGSDTYASSTRLSMTTSERVQQPDASSLRMNSLARCFAIFFSSVVKRSVEMEFSASLRGLFDRGWAVV